MELWDLFDENRNPLGKTHVRGTRKNPGEYHQVVSIWTVNDRGLLLTTLRSPEKDAEPNVWENTAGSVVAGEDSRTGAVRELWEETGIRIGREALLLLGTAKESDAFIDCYLARSNVPVDEMTMLEGETVDAKWRSFAEFEQLMEQGRVAITVKRRYAFIKDALQHALGNQV